MKLIDLDEFWNLYHSSYNVYQDESLAFDEAMKGVHVIRDAPTVHAHWVDNQGVIYCSSCGCTGNKGDRYCSYCLAIMDEEEGLSN